MLDIKIFDVDHGFSAAIDCYNHKTILLDVGFNSRNGFSPWQRILKQKCHAVDCLIMPVYVQEHLEGIPELFEHLLAAGININQVILNPTLRTDEFPLLQGTLSWSRNPLAVTAKLHPECRRVSQSMKIDDIDFVFFWNAQETCQDLRDLSLVTFLSYEDINIILPSDLKTDGWHTLLQCEDFCQRLRQVNIFVAANHGHEDGYCPEVFNYCRPDVVIVSNEACQCLSSVMLERYKNHAKGAPNGVCDRKVLTTHENGTITISKCLDRLRQITSEPQRYEARVI